MHFRFTMAILLFLAIAAASPSRAARAAGLETAVGPEALVRLELQGKVTVRALGAWGKMPERFVGLGRTLRADAGLNLLDAGTVQVADWLAQARGGDARLAPSTEGLADLLGFLERGDFLEWVAVADEDAAAPGALLRRDGRRWVRGPGGQGPAAASASSAPAAQDTEALFAGDMSDMWAPYQADGGKFKNFAKIENGMFIVDVPEGNSWGRTGMYTNATVVEHPRGARQGVRLTALFDPGASTDFVLSLVPAEAKTDDEWRYHHVRVGMHLETIDGPRTLTLWVGQQVVMTREIAEVPERIDLVLRPDDAIVVTDAGGKVLLQGVMPGDVPKDGYRLYALAGATASRRGKPVRLSLKRIERSREPFALQAAHDAPLDGARRTILFEGGVLGRWLTPLAGQGGDFRKHARLEDGEVAVNVPANSSWGKVGVYTPGPVLWLDGFGPGSEAGVTFEFDPDGTTGFVVALSPLYNLKNNDPGKPYVWAQWNRKEDGSGGRSMLLLDPDSREGAWKVETGAQAPGRVTLRISPEGVMAQGLGGPDERFPWKCAVPNLGFRVYAFSQAEKAGAPVRMALKRIVMDRVTGAPLPPEEPAPGVEPLEEATLFDGRGGEAWESYGIRGAEFAKHGRFEGGGLVAEVPAGTFSWPKVGIVSRNPVLNFNERILRTPYAVRIACDRTRTSGVEAVFRSARSPEMDKGTEVQASFVRHDTGPDAGMYVLSLSGENAIYVNWSRRVDARWVDANWDGVLEVRFGDGWVEAGLPGGPRVRGMGLRTGKGWEYYAALTTCPAIKNGGSSLALKGVVGGWVTPSGMTADERWTLVDDEDFQAEAFIDHVAESLPEEN